MPHGGAHASVEVVAEHEEYSAQELLSHRSVVPPY